MEEFDPATGSWTVLASSINPTYGATSGVINGELYIAGGWNWPFSGIPQSSLMIFNPANNSFRWGTWMPTRSGCSGGGVIGGKLYVLTACNGGGGYRKFFYVYDSAGNFWRGLPEPVSIHVDPAPAVLDGKLYIMGGTTDGSTKTAMVEIYDPAAGSWSTGVPLPEGRSSAAAQVIGGLIYVAGGALSGGQTNSVVVFDPATGAWTEGPPMSVARHTQASAVIDGRFYVVGGHDAAGPTALVEALTPADPRDALIAQLEIDLAAAQDRIDDLEIQIQTLNGTITSNQTQLNDANADKAALQIQLNDATAAITRLTARLASVAGGAASIDQAFQQIFGDPGFSIPGATTEEKIANLISAILRLNRGRKQGLYVNLGGSSGGGKGKK